MIKDYGDLEDQLTAHTDEKYRTFSAKLVLSKYPIVGVRIPEVRSIAKSIPKEKYDEFLDTTPKSLEEIIVRGIIICKLPYEKMLGQFDLQVNYIDNWCTSDIFCSELRKTIKKHEEEVLKIKVENLLTSNKEFSTRVGLVILKCAYVDTGHLSLIFNRVEKLASREEYYVKMAIAWLVSECFIKFPDETLEYLKKSTLNKWTFNMTISKICDSYRVKPETKTYLKKLRK